MENIYYLFLGSLLTLLGSFLAHRFGNHLAQLKEEQLILIEAVELLLEYPTLKEKDWKRDEIRNDGGSTFHSQKEIGIVYQIGRLPLRIQSKQNHKLAIKLTKFSLDSVFRTRTNLDALTDELHKAINKPIVAKYNNELKKTKEAVKKLMREGQTSQKDLDAITKL